jgi:Tfp pilus assembly protein FimT
MPKRAMSFSDSLMETPDSTEVGFARQYSDIARRARGVTVIELLVLLAILAVIVGLALPRLDTVHFRADANVKLVRTVLQQAQQIAVQKGRDVIVGFDTAGARIRIVEDTDGNRALSDGEPVIWRSLTESAHFVVPPIGLSTQITPGVAGNAISSVDGMPSITFGKEGTVSSNAELYIVVDGKKDRAFRAVTLTQVSPKTQWYRLTGDAWTPAG